jgi:enoyl-CoA hydratase/3-hydroxyacyl-CoA dehydrogenase
VVNEGCRVVAEKIVEKAADLDIATVLSMGFPAYRGGLLHWADTYGATYIVKRLRAFAAMVHAPPPYLSPVQLYTH